MKNSINRWDPFRDLTEFQKRLASAFGGEGGELASFGGDADWHPAVDVAEDEEAYLITADLPDVPMKLEVSGEGIRKQKQSIAGARGLVEIAVARIDPNAVKRMEEIDKEIMKAAQRMMSAKTDDERKVAREALMKLQKEKAALESGEDLPADALEPVPPDDDR